MRLIIHQIEETRHIHQPRNVAQALLREVERNKRGKRKMGTRDEKQGWQREDLKYRRPSNETVRRYEDQINRSTNKTNQPIVVGCIGFEPMTPTLSR
jgi:hypothetical protein